MKIDKDPLTLKREYFFSLSVDQFGFKIVQKYIYLFVSGSKKVKNVILKNDVTTFVSMQCNKSGKNSYRALTFRLGILHT